MKPAFLGRLLSVAVVFAASLAFAEEAPRKIPQPLPTHPGNIFLAGERVVISPPPGDVSTWRMMDYSDKVVSKGDIVNGTIDLGNLAVGYYKIVRGGPGLITNRTWIGVLAPLKAPTPRTSPICVDVGMAWFFPTEDKMRPVANLCQLAGINRVRDRLMWEEMERFKGKFSGETRYDVSAHVQSQAGLQILQVAHISASWANPNPKRFPVDLRDFYNFYREMAKRWKGQVDAFEPWNEPDIEMFGGHTGSEIASFQKAAYFGLKAGNSNVTACSAAFAIRRPDTLADFNDNQAEAYFDTYNLHHYEPLEKYPELYAAHRAISGGKPMWTTECSVHVKWRGDEKYKELSEADLRLQSERVTKTFALALHEGPEAVFYFLLPHYTERKLQYGLLREDLTPRPGYLALAAAGRLLADAKPLGRLKGPDDKLQGYLFAAKPGGKTANVLVIWADEEMQIALPQPPDESFDHIGRPHKVPSRIATVGSAPIYMVYPSDIRFNLTPPPSAPPLLIQQPGPVVLQALLPEDDILLEKSAYRIRPGQTKDVQMFAYNFGAQKLNGKLNVEVEKPWEAVVTESVDLVANDRKELTLKVICPERGNATNATVKIKGYFGDSSSSILSLRFISEPKP